MAASKYPLCLLCLLWFVHLETASVITIEDRGYKGILIAMKNTIEEDQLLVDNIKELFTNASRFLFTATGGRAYFREITIAVPASWTPQSTYEEVSGNFFSNAHVRIDEANPEYGDAPYTLQPGSCGEPGHYIHLTPWFLKELQGKTIDTFGTPERQLVHEWAHLRYGVFDEYGIPGDRRYPMFYRANGRMRPTSCIQDIKGWIENRDGGPCRIVEGGYVDSDCIFIPDMNSDDAKASIMYMPFIPAMEGFCDETDNRKHNPIAPTKQNTLCHYRSSWAVISQHPDFTNKRVTRQAPVVTTDPVFRVVKPPVKEKGRYVLVLDVSGSMNGRPMALLHRAATRLVEDRIPDGAYLGIVQFSTNASILQNLTKVTNATRKQLSASLPMKDDGGTTAIGKGIREGIKVLKANNVPAEGGLMLLITDGEENVSPFIEQVLPDLIADKVIVNTVAFGTDASSQLENVTAATGGKGYFFANIDGSKPPAALDSAFLESVTSQADIDLQPVQIKDETFLIGLSSMKREVRIDNELGKNTVFTFTSPEIQQVRVTLESPTGTVYDGSSREYSLDVENTQRIQVKFPQAETGLWKVEIFGPEYYETALSFSLTSEPKDIRQQPIRVKSWLSDLQLKYPAYAKVYAEVKKGYQAVVGATVLSTIDRPMGKTVDILLRDDGVGADVTKNDGIYSGFFTHFNGNGRYAVIARVINNGAATIKNVARSSAAIAVPKFADPDNKPSTPPEESFSSEDFVLAPTNYTVEPEEVGEPVGEFERSSDAGAFRLENWIDQPYDTIPPGSISDLEVITTIQNNATKIVILQWTSPGGDLDSGNASLLELRANREPENLLYNFNDSFLFKDTHVKNGSLVPLPPGQTQRITVSLSAELDEKVNDTETIYFAMKALDSSGNISPGHNVVGANFGIFGRNPIRSPISSESSTFKWWPLAIIVGVLVAIAVLLVSVSFYLASRRKKVYKAVAKG